jgi:ADP-ribose pyrophosphatase
VAFLSKYIVMYLMVHGSQDVPMEAYEITGTEVLWEGMYLRCLRLHYRDTSGDKRHWEAVERVNCDHVVAIVPVTDDGKMVFIRQFRPPVSSYVIEFPAGLNDRGEGPEAAVLRELREETGYEAGELVFLARGPLSSGSSREILTVYLAKGLTYKGIEGRDETEDIEVLEIPLERIYDTLSQLSEEGNLVDLKILGLIEMARRRMLI